MGVSIFGLTANSVRAHMFPQLSDFSVNSSPTLAIVTELIEEQAGTLAGKLYAEKVTASSIVATLDSNGLHSAAWLWCVGTLRLMVALECLQRMSQQYPELAKKYDDDLKTRLQNLDDNGPTALGDDSLSPGSDADGPTTHQSVYGLDGDVGEDMSSLTANKLRMDDFL